MEEPLDYAESHPLLRKDFFDEDQQEWNTSDPLFLSYDSWDDFDWTGGGLHSACVRLETSNGSFDSGWHDLFDFAREKNSPRLDVKNYLHGKAWPSQRFTSTFAQLSAQNPVCFQGIEYERNVSHEPFEIVLEKGEIFDWSRCVFEVNRCWMPHPLGAGFKDWVTSIHYNSETRGCLHPEDGGWHDCECGNGAKIVVLSNMIMQKHPAAACLSRWYRSVLARRRLAELRRAAAMRVEMRAFGLAPPVEEKCCDVPKLSMRGGGQYLEAKREAASVMVDNNNEEEDQEFERHRVWRIKKARESKDYKNSLNKMNTFLSNAFGDDCF